MVLSKENKGYSYVRFKISKLEADKAFEGIVTVKVLDFDGKVVHNELLNNAIWGDKGDMVYDLGVLKRPDNKFVPIGMLTSSVSLIKPT